MNLAELPNADFLRNVFSFPPSTNTIDLFDICLKRDGKVLILNFDLVGQLPDRPPKKWKAFNRCRLGIYCAAISRLNLTGWETRNIADLTITAAGSGYNVQVIGESVKIEFSCELISLTGPSVYLDEP